MSYAVIRPPSTQEDEGRSFLVGVYPTRKKAEEVKEENDGYYTHDIYRKVGNRRPPPARYKRKADR